MHSIARAAHTVNKQVPIYSKYSAFVMFETANAKHKGQVNLL